MGRKATVDLIATGAPRTMSTREIAELTGKNHADVLRDVRNMLEQLDERASSFAGTYQVPGPNGSERSAPCFNLPKDLTITLVSGYSVPLRHRIVKRWQELEAQQAPGLPRSFAEALRLAADQAEQIERQQQALALAAPKVEFVDRFVSADTGAMGFRQVAKLLKVKEPEFRSWLLDRKIMYRLGGVLTPHSDHITAGRFQTRAGEANGHAYSRAMFTPKGVEWIAGEWAKHQIREGQTQ
jgi:phage antirepressor YoqD-like protein